MTKRKKFLWCLLAAAVLGLLLWRFVPRSIYDVVGAPEGSIGYAHVSVVQSVFEDGQQDFRNHQASTEDLGEEALQELMTILEGKGCRSDIRNLLPGKTRELTASGQSYTISLTLFWNDGQSACSLTFLKPEAFGISRDGFDVYHPVDKDTMAKLRDFAVTYGEAE